jgi:hypothetical protein
MAMGQLWTIPANHRKGNIMAKEKWFNWGRKKGTEPEDIEVN